MQLSFLHEDRSEICSESVFQIAGNEYRATEVFDTYWRFACLRQQIYFNRLSDNIFRSEDPILQTFRFTNAYRAADRVSQYLIRHVIYAGSQDVEQVFYRVLLFKLFNKIETWEFLEHTCGPLIWSGHLEQALSNALNARIAGGHTIYSAAYIMPSGGIHFKRKHDAHLSLLAGMMTEQVPYQISAAGGMMGGFRILRAQPMLGDFLAYQFITDLNYSEICDFSEDEFVIPGPGARDGIRKCFPDLPLNLTAEAIKAVAAAQKEEFAKRGLLFPTLWGRPLQLIDCQNLFCEVDKYARVAHPHVAGVSGRTRIKQQFRSKGLMEQPMFPPKWGLRVPVQPR